MRAVGGFHQAACAFDGGSGTGSGDCEEAAPPDASDLQQQNMLRAAGSSSKSSIAALQHFLQAAGSAVGLPSAYRGNASSLSRSRGRSRTCGGVVQMTHARHKETAAGDAEGEGAAPEGHTSEESYGVPAPAAAERLRWVPYSAIREEEAASAGGRVYGSGESHAAGRHHYWSAATAAGGEEACVSLYRFSDASQKRYGDGGDRETFETGRRVLRGPLFNAAGAAAAAGLGLTEYATGQLTMSLDAVTSAGGYAGGGSYAAGVAAAAAGAGTAAAGHFSGCCAHNATGVPHSASSCWAPPSDFFSKGEYAPVPEVQTSVSAAQSSSQPSGGGCWCSSRAAAAAASAAARGGGLAEARDGQPHGDGEDEEEEEEEPLSEKGSPAAASHYPGAVHLRREQQLVQRRQRLAAGRLPQTRGGNGRAAFRRHSAVSYYAGIFAAAAAASGDSSACNEEGRCFLASGLQQHNAPDSLACVNRAHSAAAAAPLQSLAAATQIPLCIRGGGAAAAEQLQREPDERILPMPLSPQQEETHQVQAAETQQQMPQRVGREQLLLLQQNAREQLVQQQRVREHQVMQQQLAAEHERQQQSKPLLSDQQMLQQQARDYQMQQHATVDFWKSTVGTPSGACLALRSQKQQLMLLHEQLLQHSKLASTQQQQQSTRRFKEKNIRSRDRRSSCCDCRPHGSCGHCRDRIPRLLEEEEERREEDVEEEDDEDAAVGEHISRHAQQQMLLRPRAVVVRGRLGTEAAHEHRSTEEKEEDDEEEAEQSPAEAQEETSEEEEEEAAAVTGSTEEAATARAAAPYRSPARALEDPAAGQIFFNQLQQQASPSRDGRNAQAAEGNDEGAAARLFASPFKLGNIRRRPSDAAAHAAAATAAGVSSFSLPPRPRSGFPAHTSSYGSFAAVAAASGSIGGSSSSSFVPQQHLNSNEAEEAGGGEALNTISAQERGSNMQQSRVQQNCTLQNCSKHTCKREHYGAHLSPLRGASAAAASRKHFAGAGAGDGNGRAIAAAPGNGAAAGALQCAVAAAPPGDSAWPCGSTDIPPSSLQMSTAGAPAATARRSAPAPAAAVGGPHDAAESSTGSRKATLWAPSSLLKTLTRGLQQHSAGPSTTGRRSSSTLVSTTAAAAPLSVFCSSSSCTRRLSLLSSSGAAAPGGSAAVVAGPLEDAAGSSSGNGGAASAAAAHGRETKPPPPPTPRAAAAAPLTRSYSASMYRGAANHSQTCSSGGKPQQSNGGTGGYSSFSSLARVLRPRRHSHHQGEAGRRAAAAAAVLPRQEVRDTRGEVAADAAECLEAAGDGEEAAEAEAARESVAAAAGESGAAPSITSAYVGEEESNRIHREGEAASASSSSPRRAAADLLPGAAGAAGATGGDSTRAAAAAFLGVAAVPSSGRHPPRLLRDVATRAAVARHSEARRPQPRGEAEQKTKCFGENESSRRPGEEEMKTAAALAAATAADGYSQRCAEQEQGPCNETQHQESQRGGLQHGCPAHAASYADHEEQAGLSLSPNLSRNGRRSHTAPSRAGLGTGRKAAAETTLPTAEHTYRAPSAAAAFAAPASIAPAGSARAAGGGAAAAEKKEAAPWRPRMMAAAGAGGGAAAAADSSMEVASEKDLPALLHQQQQLADVACTLQPQKAAVKAFVGPRMQQEQMGEKDAGVLGDVFDSAGESYVPAAAARATPGKVSYDVRPQPLPPLEQQLLHAVASRPSHHQQRRMLQEQGPQQQPTVLVHHQPPQVALTQQQQQEAMQQKPEKHAGGATVLSNEHAVQYDIQFGGMLVRLHRKLSSKCHCQFDVWEGEAVGFVKQEQQDTGGGEADAAPADGEDQEDVCAAMVRVQQNRHCSASGGNFDVGAGNSSCSNGNGVSEREKTGNAAGSGGTGAVAAAGSRAGAGAGKSEGKANSKGTAGISKELEDAGSVVDDMASLAGLHASIVGVGRRFAIKVLEIDNCESSKLKYKTHSVLQEGKQLRDLCVQLRRSGAAAAIQNLSMCPSSNTVKLAQQRLLLLQLQHEPRPLKHPEVYVQQLDPRAAHLPLLPIPRYFWTGWGVKREDGSRVLGVAMEQIEGQPLTQILQQMRVPTKKSAALLTLEISIKFVRAQAVLSSRAALDKPIINWDTKPGNVLVELQRSPSTQQLHCLRCVIIDLGDALPGPTYSFPTRHQAGVTPSYVICTKGYCSPECAILVFMLSAVSKSSAFRRVWYGADISAQAMLAARKERFEKRWQTWVQQGYLRKISPPRPLPSAALAASGASRPLSAGAAASSAEKGTSASCGAGSAGKKAAAAGGSGYNRRDEEGAAGGGGVAKSAGDSGGAQKGQQGNSGSGGSAGSHSNSSYWEVVLSDRSVVFSTGLIIGQLFGGPSLLQVVNRDEVAALDILCEWGCTSARNLLLDRENLHSEALLPTQGVFAAQPWRDRVKTMLQHTLAFLPGERWSFQELENFLLKLHADLAATPDVAPVEAPPRAGAGNTSNHSNNHSWGVHQRHSPPALAADTHKHLQRNISLRRPNCPQAAATPF